MPMTTVIHQWKNIRLVEQPVTLPTGKDIVHTTIIHPGACVILPIAQDGNILIIRQFRPSLNRWILELPAGTMESGEPAIACAQRELEEETGYRAQNLIALGTMTPMAGFCDEIQHLYVAQGIVLSQQRQCDDDEVIEVLFLSLKEIEQKIVDGEINDAKTMACISKAKLCGLLR
jgi:ADP-ribose pyrophosphatase